MDDRILASVILPTHNRSDVLRRSIESVLQQTHSDFELIVVDDASTDQTRPMVASYGDSRIKYICHETNRGPAAARNTGIGVAKTKYVAFQDSDDVWRPDKLATQIAALEDADPDVRVCVCSYHHKQRDAANDVIHPHEVVSGDDVIGRLLRGLNIGTLTVVAERKTIQSVGGFDETLRVSEDFELCLRLAGQSRFLFLSDILVDAHESGDSLSANAALFAQAIDRIVAKHPTTFARCRSGHSVQMYRAGKYLAFERSFKKSLPYIRRALRLNPLNWRAAALLLGIMTGAVGQMRSIKK